MIRGYVSSDEDDYDDFDFGYSEPLVRRNSPPPFPSIQTKEIREELHSALEHSKKVRLFLKAIDEGNLETLEKLIALGVNVDTSEPQKWTPLMKACGIGKVEVVRFLLDHGSDPNLHKELFTPLMACCTYSLIEEELKFECVSLLLDHGANINAKDKFGTTALMYAIGSGYIEIVNLFLEVPDVNVNIQDKEGWSALFYAVNHNHIDTVKKLIAAGSDLNFTDRYDRTVLNLALDKDLKEVAYVLGYEEESVIDVSEDVKENLTKKFLQELPSENGEGGFASDAQNILALFKQYKVKKISLPDFLNITDQDLYDIGVKLEHDRKKILKKGIHRYHLIPWMKSSMHQIPKGVPMRMEDAIAITGNLVKHLTIANASLRYLKKRILSRMNTEPLDLSVEKELINVLVTIHSNVEQIHYLLNKILRQINKIQAPVSADFIYPNKKSLGKSIKKYFWCIMSAAVAGYIIYHFKSRS